MSFHQGDSGGPLVQRGGKWKAVGDKWIQVRIGPGLRLIISKFRLKFCMFKIENKLASFGAMLVF